MGHLESSAGEQHQQSIWMSTALRSQEASTLSVDGVIEKLTTDRETGIVGEDEIERRRRFFGANELETKDDETLLHKYLDQVNHSFSFIYFLSLLFPQHDI